MNKIINFKFLISTFFILSLLSIIVLTPLKTSAQTETVSRADLLLKIENLTKLIQLLKLQLAQKVIQPTYQLYQIGDPVILAGGESTIAELSITPRNLDTYLNSAGFEFHTPDSKSLPWKTFKKLKVYYKGKMILEKPLNVRNDWVMSQYGGVDKLWYGINIFYGNIKIPLNDNDRLEFVLETESGISSSSWEVRVPSGAIAIWDKVNTNRYIGDPNKIIPVTVEADKNFAQIKAGAEQAKGTISVVQIGPSTIRVTGELVPPSNCAVVPDFEFLLKLGDIKTKTITLDSCLSQKIDEVVALAPSQISQYVELTLRQVDVYKNVWVNYDQARVQIISTNPQSLQIINLTNVIGKKG